MKKFLRNYVLEDYVDSLILYRGKDYYNEDRILDIWCQNDLIVSQYYVYLLLQYNQHL